MKTYDETIRAVFQGRDARLKEKARKNRRLKRTLIPIACGAAVLAAGLALWRGGRLQKDLSTAKQTADVQTTVPAVFPEAPAPPPEQTQVPVSAAEPSAAAETTAAGVSQGYTVPAPVESAPNGSAVTAPAQRPTEPDVPDEGNYGGPVSGGIGGAFIPALPADRTIAAVGETITDEEAAAYFAERKNALAVSLGASGVAADDLRVSERGYCHVSYAGAEGERLEARENFRDYLVYNGDTLVAIVTLSKEGGRLFDTPAFGAPWFKDYDAFLRQHKGEALLYVYAGLAEFILTPDGSVYSPLQGIEPRAYLEGISDPYALFYHPSAVFVP